MTQGGFTTVLFDLDGTLVDTTHLYEDACVHAFAYANVSLTPDTFAAAYATGLPLSKWLEMFGADVSLAESIQKLRDERYVSLLREQAEWLDGAVSLLESLSGKPFGIVTGSWRQYVDAIDERLRLSSHTDIIVTRDEVGERRKPDPLGLHLALDAMNADAETCLYVGDQQFDIDAARAAGMKSCLIRSRHTPEGVEEEADMVIEALEEVLGILGE